MAKETCSVQECKKHAKYNILITHLRTTNSENFLHEYYFCKAHKPIYSIFDDGPFEAKPELITFTYNDSCSGEPLFQKGIA